MARLTGNILNYKNRIILVSEKLARAVVDKGA